LSLDDVHVISAHGVWSFLKHLGIELLVHLGPLGGTCIVIVLQHGGGEGGKVLLVHASLVWIELVLLHF